MTAAEPRNVEHLRKRRDFLAAAKAQKAGVASLLLQGRRRSDTTDVRVGFTVTKKVGNAVVRNRIRRRLREAARAVVLAASRPGHDYVLVARPHALRAPFQDLVRDLERAMNRLHAGAGKTSADRSARADGARSE